MAWLLRQGEVLASLERERADGRRPVIFRRQPLVGALLVRSRRPIHTIGARRALDVAWLDAEYVVVDTCRMAPNRIGLPRRHACSILQAEAGAFERWKLRPGDRLEIEE